MNSNTAPTNEPIHHLVRQEQVQHYEREGYLVLRGIFGRSEVQSLADDVERVLAEQRALLDPCNMRTRFKPHYETAASLFEVFDPFLDLSCVARRMARDQRVLAVLESLYGEPAVLFKDKLIYKAAGTAGADLHQDWISWPGFPKSFVTVLLAIDPFHKNNGATQVYAREHRRGYLSPLDGQHHPLDGSEFATPPVCLQLDPGDMAIFSCFTPHVSGPNTGTTPRRGYFMSYNASSDGGDQYASHYRDFHNWIRRKAPADRRHQLYFR